MSMNRYLTKIGVIFAAIMVVFAGLILNDSEPETRTITKEITINNSQA